MIKDLFYDKGKLSSTKTMSIIGFLASLWALYENVHSQYIVEILAIVLGLPYANRQTTRYMDIKETFQSQKNIKVDNPDA